MAKTLYDLTRDEWNTLFPIELTDHNPNWKHIFQQEKERLTAAIGTDRLQRIEHFGSSSIPGIKSKPYIDMLIEIPKELLFDQKLIEDFESLDYAHFTVPERGNIAAYSSFGKGYRLDGKQEQIFHIHMCPKENVMWRQLEFRNYLIGNPNHAKQYEALKVELSIKFRTDRGAYVLGKTDFIEDTLRLVEAQDR